MKRILPFILLVVLFFSFTGCKKESTNILYDKKYIDEIKEVRSELSFYLARSFIPGGTFAIAKDGKIIYSEAIGFASKDLNVKMTRDSKLRIGHVSELFTSLIYRKLEEKGIMHPDSLITTYLTDFPGFNFDVSIKHLVDHTSGIRPLNFSEEDSRALNVSIQRGIEKLKDEKIEITPGHFQDYSGFNYNLLGAAMEKATGKRFAELLKEYVTDTLGLANTLIDNPYATIEGRSDFYDHNMVAQAVNATTRDLRFRAPSQGLLSNAEDLVNFGMAMLHAEYISEELKKLIFEKVILVDGTWGNIASGWLLLQDAKGRIAYGRDGKVVGGGAALLIYPEEDLVIAGAVNLTSNFDEIPVFTMASPFLPDENEIENKAKKNTPE